jgi:hypothetical protein
MNSIKTKKDKSKQFYNQIYSKPLWDLIAFKLRKNKVINSRELTEDAYIMWVIEIRIKHSRFGFPDAARF